MEAVGRGDGPSVEFLVSRYHAQLLGFFFRMLVGDRATAEDLIQETFVKLLRQSTYSPDRAFRPWLFAVAANLARDHLRKASRRPAVDDAAFAALEDPRPGPEALAASWWLLGSLRATLRRKPTALAVLGVELLGLRHQLRVLQRQMRAGLWRLITPMTGLPEASMDTGGGQSD